MRILFSFLCCMVVGAANAATMCVPDLSTCDSCSDFKTVGQMFWSANCCGVPVSGWWIGYNGNIRSVDIETLSAGDLNASVGGSGYNLCVMMSPFVAPYAVNVVHSVLAASDDCSGFIPKCAVTYCDETVPQISGDWW